MTRIRQRNVVERAINKLTQFRTVATRYDKREFMYQAAVDVATMKIWLRDLTRGARDTPRRRSADQAATRSSAARLDVLESSSMHPHEPIETLAYGGVVSMKSEPTYLTSTAGEVTAAAGHAWRVVAVHQDVAQSLVAGGIGR
ncbi:hypothetical protein [Micromonospora globbae]|uniref:hypothetical protein n=1 Tax=Micromonospora globbae TaxID=1894969 RepID=UPI003868D36D|nr:hypothetical protein OH732_14110 [Micromonospora globbae]